MKNVCAIVLLAGALLPAAAFAQHRDPLTDHETDQLRDSNYEPEKRIKLYLDFAKARLLAVDQLRSDPKPSPDRTQRIHDLLEDFGNIMDELDDNLDMYAKQRHNDIRKELKSVIEADEDLRLRLRVLRQATAANPADNKAYGATLDDAADSVATNADAARDLLEQQDAAAGAAKKEKGK